MKLPFETKTSNGRDAVIFANKPGQDYPLLGIVQMPDGEWETESWTAKGHRFVDDHFPADILNLPLTIEPGKIYRHKNGHRVLVTPFKGNQGYLLVIAEKPDGRELRYLSRDYAEGLIEEIVE